MLGAPAQATRASLHASQIHLANRSRQPDTCFGAPSSKEHLGKAKREMAQLGPLQQHLQAWGAALTLSGGSGQLLLSAPPCHHAFATKPSLQEMPLGRGFEPHAPGGGEGAQNPTQAGQPARTPQLRHTSLEAGLPPAKTEHHSLSATSPKLSTHYWGLRRAKVKIQALLLSLPLGCDLLPEAAEAEQVW